jgi:hypothetical protein
MSNRRKDPLPEEITLLKRRISEWRNGRTERSPMPGEIWESAVTLAQIFGACKIARAVDLDYKSLRLRVVRAIGNPGLVSPAFVQLQVPTAAESVPMPAPGATIEISAPDGSRMWVQLEAGHGMEARAIVAAFLGSRG